MYRPVSACGLTRVQDERTRLIQAVLASQNGNGNGNGRRAGGE